MVWTFILIIIVHRILLSVEPKSWKWSTISTFLCTKMNSILFWGNVFYLYFICLLYFIFRIQSFCFLGISFLFFFFVVTNKASKKIGSLMSIIILWNAINQYLTITLETSSKRIKWWFYIDLHLMMCFTSPIFSDTQGQKL
jgi:hypothetical protein